MADLQLTVNDVSLTATWTDSNPTTRSAIIDALPLEGDAARWGDELYFETPVNIDGESTQTEVPVGAIAYWPTGNALCLFWGPTPASTDTSPRAASPVSVVAVIDDPSALTELTGGAHVHIDLF